jgi:hypothetical protein
MGFVDPLASVSNLIVVCILKQRIVDVPTALQATVLLCLCILWQSQDQKVVRGHEHDMLKCEASIKSSTSTTQSTLILDSILTKAKIFQLRQVKVKDRYRHIHIATCMSPMTINHPSCHMDTNTEYILELILFQPQDFPPSYHSPQHNNSPPFLLQ